VAPAFRRPCSHFYIVSVGSERYHYILVHRTFARSPRSEARSCLSASHIRSLHRTRVQRQARWRRGMTDSYICRKYNWVYQLICCPGLLTYPYASTKLRSKTEKSRATVSNRVSAVSPFSATLFPFTVKSGQ